MPTYDTATAAFVAGASSKWLDNIASRFDLAGVSRDRQGVSRAFSFDAIVRITLVRLLRDELGTSTSRALSLSARLLDAEFHNPRLIHGLMFSLDLDVLRQEVRHRLLEAAESVPKRKRGRPRGSGAQARKAARPPSSQTRREAQRPPGARS